MYENEVWQNFVLTVTSAWPRLFGFQAADSRSRTGNLRKSAKEPRICLEENQLTTNDWDILKHLAKLLGFYEDAVKTLEGDGQLRKRKGGWIGSININPGWEKLNKYYTLHPAFRWGYFENEWKDNTTWVTKAK
ncbi:hypothetical protein B0I35DRAFT_465893 [Stachybotrys elegans]|uniref:Uncharacterized protein n=1 Tax=Stachybotrys elegans TaxID=80388 RepID=A0A8K0WJH2_9HYPO|nr:hypothetical protein B0I35DRAFT_465893 [Stachybotrys elegans]